MVIRHEVSRPDGRVLQVYEHAPSRPSGQVVVWHHGSLHTGALIDSLIAPADERGIRLVTYARPSYGG